VKTNVTRDGADFLPPKGCWNCTTPGEPRATPEGNCVACHEPLKAVKRGGWRAYEAPAGEPVQNRAMRSR
jgi:hypothetical protein